MQYSGYADKDLVLVLSLDHALCSSILHPGLARIQAPIAAKVCRRAVPCLYRLLVVLFVYATVR